MPMTARTGKAVAGVRLSCVRTRPNVTTDVKTETKLEIVQMHVSTRAVRRLFAVLTSIRSDSLAGTVWSRASSLIHGLFRIYSSVRFTRASRRVLPALQKRRWSRIIPSITGMQMTPAPRPRNASVPTKTGE